MTEFWRAILTQIIYFQNGNYLTLKRVVEEAYLYSFSKDSFSSSLYYEVVRLLHLVGAIEISDNTSQIRWSSLWHLNSPSLLSFLNDHSSAPEKNTAIFFKFSDSKFDFYMSRSSLFDDLSAKEKFEERFSQVLPSFSSVIEQSTSSRIWSEYIREEQVEVFDMQKQRWTEIPSYLINENCLIRRKLEMGNFELLLVLPQKDLVRKILSQEWSYILLLRDQNKNLDLLKIGQSLNVKLPVRLPSLFYKLILLSSSDVYLDYGYRFFLTSNEPVNFFNEWLEG